MQAIHDWPAPRSAVHGFLGLAGYYRKFVHNYGTVAAPLTALLKKDGFSWDDAAATAFSALKAAVTSGPILAMPDFAKLFVVECNASRFGFGAVLVQEGHPVAGGQWHHVTAPWPPTSANSLALFRHWRPYLWGRRFLVKTDHYSLKYLLDQRLATIPQQHWVGKLLGFDFTVEYRSGETNAVAALYPAATTRASCWPPRRPGSTSSNASATPRPLIQRWSPSTMSSVRAPAPHRGPSPMAWSPWRAASTYHQHRHSLVAVHDDDHEGIHRCTVYGVTFISPTCVIWCRNL